MFAPSLSRWSPSPRHAGSRPPPPDRRRQTSFRPRPEALEDRTVLSTISVWLSGDGGGLGTLRNAVARANLSPDADTILLAGDLVDHPIVLTGGPLALVGDLTI